MSRAGLEGLISSGHAPPQEIFLVPNDLKPPNSKQWSAGVRHDFGSFNGSISYNGSRGYNGYSYEWANPTYDPAQKRLLSFLEYSGISERARWQQRVHNWYKAMFLSLDRPYQRRMR